MDQISEGKYHNYIVPNYLRFGWLPVTSKTKIFTCEETCTRILDNLYTLKLKFDNFIRIGRYQHD